jgi:hypothetical protein
MVWLLFQKYILVIIRIERDSFKFTPGIFTILISTFSEGEKNPVMLVSNFSKKSNMEPIKRK